MHDRTTIQIPEGDDREYKLIRLDNDLEALIISDSKADKAAAALDVKVGHFSDPIEVPGLAHFCEHMLFLGTEKYPQEGSYQDFIKQNGGSTNAYTDMENTNYFFDVIPSQFEEGLDRFSQFFISPLFSQDATARELRAVHSEHSKNVQEDSWRQFQFLKSSCNPEHPFHKFGTGNLSTLDPPPEQNIDVRTELLKFHSAYYSSNIMKLVVSSSQSIETLESWVRNKFSAIQNKAVSMNRSDLDDVPLFTNEQLGKYYRIASVRDLRELTLVFPIPIAKDHYYYKPDHYWSHLLGHESEGSIFSCLKNKGWVNSLSAGQTCKFQGNIIFSIVCSMTQQGEVHYNEIISVIFDYLHEMRTLGVAKWVHDECKDIAAVQFRFLEKINPTDFCSSLSVNMQKYDSEHIISGGRLLFKYDEARIFELLKYFVPSNMNIIHANQSNASIAEHKEIWYETPYKVDPISSEFISEWNIPGVKKCDLHLPQPNPFIPKDLQIRPPPSGNDSTLSLIKKEPYCNLWFKQDLVYNRPRVNLFHNIVIPGTYSSPHNIIMARLFALLISDSLTQYSYYGDLAGVSYDIQPSVTGFNVYLSGYNDKISVLNQKVFSCAFGPLEDFLVEDRFELIKEQLHRTFKNMRKDQPYQHCVGASMQLMYQVKYTFEEYELVVQQITFDHLKQFIPVWLSCCRLDALYHGNMSKDEALALNQSTLDIIKTRWVPLKSQEPDERVVNYNMHKNTYIRRQEEYNQENKNSAIEVVYQIGIRTARVDAMLDLFCQVFSNPFYTQIRTVEQIGYIVFSRVRVDHNISSLSLIVQSSEKSPLHMVQRSDLFVASFGQVLSEVKQEEIDKHIKSLIAKKLEKDKQLKQETLRYWGEIVTGQFCFDRRLKQVKELENITKEELVDFYKKIISNSKIVTMMVSHQHVEELNNREADGIYIDDVCDFKKGKELYESQVNY
ncbi:insulysin [Acrasis kona]|uniref:Insulysin n=1 Tax=Acrasis kona TaxID=1008807 RepID=A0AAW2ZSJ8_9EUKA